MFLISFSAMRQTEKKNRFDAIPFNRFFAVCRIGYSGKL